MAMVIGDQACSTGASEKIWAVLSAAGMPGAQLPSEDPTAYQKRVTALKKTCYAIAHIINEVKNADVATIVATTGNGAGIDSLGGVHSPTFPLAVASSGTGTGTGPGSVT